MMLFDTQRDGTALGFSTMLLEDAWFTVFHRKLDLDDLVVMLINGRSPTHTLLLCWTGRMVRLPIDVKASGIKPLLFLGLPLVISAGRSNQIDPIGETTIDVLFGLGVIGIS